MACPFVDLREAVFVKITASSNKKCIDKRKDFRYNFIENENQYQNNNSSFAGCREKELSVRQKNQHQGGDKVKKRSVFAGVLAVSVAAGSLGYGMTAEAAEKRKEVKTLVETRGYYADLTVRYEETTGKVLGILDKGASKEDGRPITGYDKDRWTLAYEKSVAAFQGKTLEEIRQIDMADATSLSLIHI